MYYPCCLVQLKEVFFQESLNNSFASLPFEELMQSLKMAHLFSQKPFIVVQDLACWSFEGNSLAECMDAVSYLRKLVSFDVSNKGLQGINSFSTEHLRGTQCLSSGF